MSNGLLATMARWGIQWGILGALLVSTTVDPFCQWYHLEVKPQFSDAESAASWAGEHCYDTECYEKAMASIRDMKIYGGTNEQWREFFCGEGVQP